MAKHKKKRPAEGRLKVIAGGGGVKAVLPGKGPQWKKDRAQPPSVGAHAASAPKSGPPNRRRDEDDDESADAAVEASPSKSTRKPIPRVWIFGAIGVAILVVGYYALRNPSPGETPTTQGVATTSASTTTSSVASASNVAPEASSSAPMASTSAPVGSPSVAPSSSADTKATASAPTTSASNAKPSKKPEEPSEYQ
jgi:hypothetical protein